MTVNRTGTPERDPAPSKLEPGEHRRFPAIQAGFRPPVYGGWPFEQADHGAGVLVASTRIRNGCEPACLSSGGFWSTPRGLSASVTTQVRVTGRSERRQTGVSIGKLGFQSDACPHLVCGLACRPRRRMAVAQSLVFDPMPCVVGTWRRS